MSVLIKDLPKEDMPRERLLKYGKENLSNEELIAIILRTGTKNKSSKDLANSILKKINSIEELRSININDLKKIKGLGDTKIITLLAALELGKRVYENDLIIDKLQINNSVDIYRYFSKYIIDEKQENFMVIYLDNHKQYISHKILFKGTINKSIVSPREVFKEAFLCDASAIVIMHNHPSGIVMPSKSDDETTNEILNAGNAFGIPLLDHLIVGNGDYYSYLEEGNLKYE